jgi:heme/copper-type cytochrome/quinol oxidase subunit 2
MKYFLFTAGLKILNVFAMYTVTYIVDMVNDRLKLLNPEDKVNNEASIIVIILLFIVTIFFSGVRGLIFYFVY